MKADGLVHDARDEYGLLYDLHHKHYNGCGNDDPPEILPCIGSLYQGEEYHGDDGGDLQIRHDVEQADKESEADSHGEIDDEEPDAEEDAHAEGYEQLAAEIVAHSCFYFVGKFNDALAVLLGNESFPTIGQCLVIVEDKKGVHHEHEYGYHARDEAERLRYDIPNFGEEVLRKCADALDGKICLYLLHVNMLTYEAAYRIGDGTVVFTGGEIVDDKLF